MAKKSLFVAAAMGIMLLAVFPVGATGQTESAAASQGPVTLQYAFWGDQNEIDATNAYLNGYMAKFPNVKIEPLNFGSNTQFNTKITTLAASNTLPDLGYFYEPNVLTWGMNGQFVDLTDFYKNAPAKLDAIKFVTPDGKIVGHQRGQRDSGHLVQQEDVRRGGPAVPAGGGEQGLELGPVRAALPRS